MSKIIGIAAVARSGKDTVASMLLKHSNVRTYALADPLKIGCQVLFGLTDAETWSDELKEVDISLWGWSPRRLFQTVGTDWLRKLNADHWLLRASLAFKANTTISEPSEIDLTDQLAPFKMAAQAIFGLSYDDVWNSENLDQLHPYWKMTPKQMIDFLKDHTYSVFPNYHDLRSQRSIAPPTRTIPSHGENDIVIIKDIRFENEAAFIRNLNGVIWHIKRDNAIKVISHSSEHGIAVQKIDIVIDNNGSLEDLEIAVNSAWIGLNNSINTNLL